LRATGSGCERTAAWFERKVNTRHA
jgi:hypothetical protein